ncbi:hypothetical protein [Neisseria lactamica]|uniref:hypothetical protein n=1 Tax=Neisseria lactamica TaxID=486 RepID=UPI00031C05DF|nr:hypothetical protein [Neisseria lactamica]
MPSKRRKSAIITRLQINEMPFYHNDYYYQKTGKASCGKHRRGKLQEKSDYFLKLYLTRNSQLLKVPA